MIEFTDIKKGKLFIENIANALNNNEINEFIIKSYFNNLSNSTVIINNNFLYKTLTLKQNDSVILFIKCNNSYSNIKIDYKSSNNREISHKEIIIDGKTITYIDLNSIKTGYAIYDKVVVNKTIKKYINDLLYYKNNSITTITDYENDAANKTIDEEIIVLDNEAIKKVTSIDKDYTIKYFYTDKFNKEYFTKALIKIDSSLFDEINEQTYLNYLSVFEKENILKLKK